MYRLRSCLWIVIASTTLVWAEWAIAHHEHPSNANSSKGGIPKLQAALDACNSALVQTQESLASCETALAATLEEISLMVQTDPADPNNERFLDEWRFQIHNIDDKARVSGPVYYGETDSEGNGVANLPSYMLTMPLVINAYNEAYPLADVDDDGALELRSLKVFVPSNCHDEATWRLSPLEDAVWRYYRGAAARGADAWNPSQVDCATWLSNLQQLNLTNEIDDGLHALSDSDSIILDDAALFEAFQKNQALLVPARPAICMAARRHNGGSLERDAIIDAVDFPSTIDNDVAPHKPFASAPDSDPVVIGINGIVESVCGHALVGELNVNQQTFSPTDHYELDDAFMGRVHDHADIVSGMDVTVFNVRTGNGHQLKHDKYDDACSLSTLIEISNTDDVEQDVLTGTGVTFTDLFGVGVDVAVHLTSDGDAVIDDDDHWVILHAANDDETRENVLTIELPGHRQEDFRDVLHMSLTGEDLFIGLRDDYELNEEEVDGESAYLGFTITTWDGTTDVGRKAIRQNISNCYEASDEWARQFFVTSDFQVCEGELCFESDHDVESTIDPLVAAEFAARSQCFSNSLANARWQTDDAGRWSMNGIKGVHANVIINPGWLAPELAFEMYVQKFDEAIFKGPRTISRTDARGQLMTAMPNLSAGDRVLIKSEDNCCDDYDFVISCVPEFTGFGGVPGMPYVP